MICKDRNGVTLSSGDGQDRLLKGLYTTSFGRGLVRVLINPFVSKAGGMLLNRKVSKVAIKPFVRQNNIDLKEYEDREFTSYNDFFMRKIKEEARPVDMRESSLIAPCDSKLMAYPINEDSKFLIKDTWYTLASLLRSKKAADAYKNGTLLLFRLTVDDYHRFCYIDNGRKSKNYKIPGVFHTVNPVANDEFPIYKENTREFTFIKSENFGTVMQMEVGALMVGKIVNYHEEQQVFRGMEKGRFEFGGSTIILCFKEGKVKIDEDILENSKAGIETKVKYGMKIGGKNHD